MSGEPARSSGEKPSAIRCHAFTSSISRRFCVSTITTPWPKNSRRSSPNRFMPPPAATRSYGSDLGVRRISSPTRGHMRYACAFSSERSIPTVTRYPRTWFSPSRRSRAIIADCCGDS